MRILAVIGNVAVLGLFCFLLVEKGLPKDGTDIVIALVLLLSPIVNLAAPFRGNGWLTLYLKRKALEEQVKIEQLGRKPDA